MIKAVIYCRVSSDRQVKEGHGLDSQEKLCRNYAKGMGYKVLAVFREEGESGGLFERTAMKQLLAFLEEHDTNSLQDKIVVIFDDLKRFARDVEIHFRLKKEIYGRNARVESPNFKFEDTPEGKFVETMMAASAELERNQNKRQVIQKMRARLEAGYWPFAMPLGLINEPHPIHGRILVKREPFATIYKKAIEGFRDSQFVRPEDVQQYIQNEYKKHGITRKMPLSTVMELLREELYAGYIRYEKWGIPMQKAKHEGFISLETYNTVQERLQRRTKPWTRRDYSLDFPLRPHVLCAACRKPMTASWCTGRRKRYPNYFCRVKGCIYNWKVVKKHKIEGEFETLLTQVKPPEEVVDLTKDVLNEEWQERIENASLYRSNMREELDEVKVSIKDWVKRIKKTKNESLVEAYEEEVGDLKAREKELEKQLGKESYTDADFGTASERVFGVLKKPLEMWKSDDYEDKRTILFMYFEEQLQYDYEKGFGTAGLASPLRLMHQKAALADGSVEMSGCDPESEKYF